MTERLSHLLTAEADGLDIPAPPTDDVLARGKGVRRRRRLALGGAALATAAVVGGAAFVGTGTGAGEPDAAADTGVGPVLSVGNTVYYDGADHSVTIDDKAVKSLYYTSEGVLVRHGDNPWSDGGGPQRFSVISADGEVRRLGLVTEETVHASDPDEPYVVYAENVGGTLEAVVYDVAADREAARVPVGPTQDSWFGVAYDAGTVYVQDGESVFAVDWEAGTAEPSALTSTWELAGGRAATIGRQSPTVVDIATGEQVLDAEATGFFDLSPDGRFAMDVDEEGAGGGTPTTVKVYDIATGQHITLDGYAYDWGWTPDGDLFRTVDDELLTCDATTGACASEPFALPEEKPDEAIVSCVDVGVPAGRDRNKWIEKHRDEIDTGGVEICEDTDVLPVETFDEVKLGGRVYES